MATVPVLLLVGLVPLVAGLRGHALMAAAWGISLLAIGVLIDTAAPRGYDMPDLGLGLGVMALIISLLAWCLGAAIRAVADEEADPPEPDR